MAENSNSCDRPATTAKDDSGEERPARTGGIEVHVMTPAEVRDHVHTHDHDPTHDGFRGED